MHGTNLAFVGEGEQVATQFGNPSPETKYAIRPGAP
jgi:hypothetical protein